MPAPSKQVERKVVAVLGAEVAENMLYGGGGTPDHRALTKALRDALDVARTDHDPDETAALARAFESSLHRFVATTDHCPNFGEATESCDCLICRTQTVLTEWLDETAPRLLRGEARASEARVRD